MTFGELRALCHKDHDEMLREDLMRPPLVEYIRICKKYNKEIIKHFRPDEIDNVIKIIRAKGWLERTIFISL